MACTNVVHIAVLFIMHSIWFFFLCRFPVIKSIVGRCYSVVLPINFVLFMLLAFIHVAYGKCIYANLFLNACELICYLS